MHQVSQLRQLQRAPLLPISYHLGRTRVTQQQSSMESLENCSAENLPIHLSIHMSVYP